MKLTPERYYQWMLAIEKMAHHQTKLDHKMSTYSMMSKEIEIAQLKLHIFKDTIKHQDSLVKEARKEYDELKSAIEQEIGFSLNGCSVTDTFEIIKLEDSK